MDLLTFDLPPDDGPIVERLATGGLDVGRAQFHAMAGEPRVASPPALTPLLRRFDSSYIGIWRHPVVKNRSTTYVEYVWETSRAREIATTAEQLVAWLFVVLLEIVDDPETDRRWGELSAAAATLGLDDLDGFYDETLDGASALYGLPAFRQRPPRDAAGSAHDAYAGEFPRLADPSSAAAAAGCEVPVDAPSEWLDAARTGAAWLGPGSPVAVFGDRLAAGDLPGAWLALNSPGWPVEPVEHALDQLTAASDDAGLALLAEDWLARTDRRTGGY